MLHRHQGTLNKADSMLDLSASCTSPGEDTTGNYNVLTIPVSIHHDIDGIHEDQAWQEEDDGDDMGMPNHETRKTSGTYTHIAHS